MKEELFGITSQIRRACISVSCNLAEGSARKTPKEQLRFYEIAFASAAEVVNLLILTNDLELLSDDDYKELRSDVEKITFQINNLSRGFLEVDKLIRVDGAPGLYQPLSTFINLHQHARAIALRNAPIL